MIEVFFAICSQTKAFILLFGLENTNSSIFSFQWQLLDEQKSVQTEVDAGFEGENHVTLIEAKNTGVDGIIRSPNFIILQMKWSEHVSQIWQKIISVFFAKEGL